MLIPIQTFLTLVVWSLIPTGLPAAPEGGDSPQAVFDAVRAAAQSSDAAAVVGQLPPSHRCNLMVGMIDRMDDLVFASTDATATSQAWLEVAEKHSFRSDAERLESFGSENADEAAAFVQDFRERLFASGCSAFLADTLAFVDAVMKAEDYSGHLLSNFPTTSDVEYQTLSEDRVLGHVDGQQLRFLREDGRWYFAAQVLFP